MCMICFLQAKWQGIKGNGRNMFRQSNFLCIYKIVYIFVYISVISISIGLRF